MTGLERIQKLITGELPPPPIAQLIGFRVTAVEPGRATVLFEAEPRHANPMGTLHGGILCDVTDAAMGMAYSALLKEGESFTTLELKINFFKPVWNDTLRAEAKMVKPGKTIGVVECDVFDAKGSLVARASSTCMTLRGAEAADR